MLALRKMDSLFTAISMSPRFDTFFLYVIVLNALWLGIDVEYNEKSGEESPEQLSVFVIVENVFTILFIVELWIRFKAYRR